MNLDFLCLTKRDLEKQRNTFELDFENSVSPPFNFLNHKTEAILHYSGTEKPTPTE